MFVVSRMNPGCSQLIKIKNNNYVSILHLSRAIFQKHYSQEWLLQTFTNLPPPPPLHLISSRLVMVIQPATHPPLLLLLLHPLLLPQRQRTIAMQQTQPVAASRLIQVILEAFTHLERMEPCRTRMVCLWHTTLTTAKASSVHQRAQTQLALLASCSATRPTHPCSQHSSSSSNSLQASLMDSPLQLCQAQVLFRMLL